MKKKSYSRPLTNVLEIRHFLFTQLEYPGDKSIIAKIIKGEGMLTTIEANQTSNSKNYRDSDFSDDVIRWKLRKQIAQELFE